MCFWGILSKNLFLHKIFSYIFPYLITSSFYLSWLGLNSSAVHRTYSTTGNTILFSLHSLPICPAVPTKQSRLFPTDAWWRLCPTPSLNSCTCLFVGSRDCSVDLDLLVHQHCTDSIVVFSLYVLMYEPSHTLLFFYSILPLKFKAKTVSVTQWLKSSYSDPCSALWRDEGKNGAWKDQDGEEAGSRVLFPSNTLQPSFSVSVQNCPLYPSLITGSE